MLNLTDAFLFLTWIYLINIHWRSSILYTLLQSASYITVENQQQALPSRDLSFQCGEGEREENDKAKYTESKMTVSTDKEGQETQPGQGYDFT